MYKNINYLRYILEHFGQALVKIYVYLVFTTSNAG